MQMRSAVRCGTPSQPVLPCRGGNARRRGRRSRRPARRVCRRHRSRGTGRCRCSRGLQLSGGSTATTRQPRRRLCRPHGRGVPARRVRGRKGQRAAQQRAHRQRAAPHPPSRRRVCEEATPPADENLPRIQRRTRRRRTSRRRSTGWRPPPYRSVRASAPLRRRQTSSGSAPRRGRNDAGTGCPAPTVGDVQLATNADRRAARTLSRAANQHARFLLLLARSTRQSPATALKTLRGARQAAALATRNYRVFYAARPDRQHHRRRRPVRRLRRSTSSAGAEGGRRARRR